jgi:hypothetical protein
MATPLFTPQAPLPIYAADIILAANLHKSLLENTVTRAGIDQGSSYTFQVADATYSYAKERGNNGLIPTGNFTQQQISVDIVQRWSKVEKSFEELKGDQGDIKSLMVTHCAGEIARTKDKVVLDELDASSTEFDSSVITASADAFLDMTSLFLQNKFALTKGSLFAVIGPSAWAQLNKSQEFKNSLISNKTPLQNLDFKFTDEPMIYDFQGIYFIYHPGIPGIGTAQETNFLYHKTAIGAVTCVDNSMDVSNGIVPGQAKQFCLAGLRTASKALQTTGLLKFYTQNS